MTDLMDELQKLEACYEDGKLAKSVQQEITKTHQLYLLREMATRIMNNEIAIAQNTEQIANQQSSYAGPRAPFKIRELTPEEENQIAALVAANRVTTSNSPKPLSQKNGVLRSQSNVFKR